MHTWKNSYHSNYLRVISVWFLNQTHQSKCRPESFVPLFLIITRISTGGEIKSNTSRVNQPSSTFAACWHHLLILLCGSLLCRLPVNCFFLSQRIKWQCKSDGVSRPCFVPSLLRVHVHVLCCIGWWKRWWGSDGVSPLHMKEKCRLFVFAVTTQEVQKVTFQTYPGFISFFFPTHFQKNTLFLIFSQCV